MAAWAGGPAPRRKAPPSDYTSSSQWSRSDYTRSLPSLDPDVPPERDCRPPPIMACTKRTARTATGWEAGQLILDFPNPWKLGMKAERAGSVPAPKDQWAEPRSYDMKWTTTYTDSVCDPLFSLDKLETRPEQSFHPRMQGKPRDTRSFGGPIWMPGTPLPTYWCKCGRHPAGTACASCIGPSGRRRQNEKWYLQDPNATH